MDDSDLLQMPPPTPRASSSFLLDDFASKTGTSKVQITTSPPAVLEIWVFERAKISSVCFDILLDDVFAMELLFEENECCIVVVGPGA